MIFSTLTFEASGSRGLAAPYYEGEGTAQYLIRVVRKGTVFRIPGWSG